MVKVRPLSWEHPHLPKVHYVLLNFWPHSHWEPCHNIDPLCLTKCPVGFEPEMFQFQFKPITHWATFSKLFYYILLVSLIYFSISADISIYNKSAMITVSPLCNIKSLVQHQITGKPWYFCWNCQSLKIRKNLKYSFNFRCYRFYVTTFKSFIFLIHPLCSTSRNHLHSLHLPTTFPTIPSV